MTQAITESFCERCGTRYEFKAPTRLNTMRKTRGLVTGLRNYIMSQDALGDAIGDGIRTEEEALASHQLDAFHQSFNFCIDCRQYTCINCWNDDAGRCRSCAPVAGTDDLLRRLEAATAHDAAQAAELEGAALDLGTEAWPSSDLVLAEANGNGHAGMELLTTDLDAIADAVEEPPVPEPDRVAAESEPDLEPEPFTYAIDAEPDAQPFQYAFEPEPIDLEPIDDILEAEPEAAIAEPPVHILAWDDDAVAEAEPRPMVAEDAVAEAQPQPMVAEDAVAEAEPEPMVAEAAPEPEPMVAEAAPEPEPMVAEAAPEPIPFDRRSYTPISETIMPMPRSAPAPAEDRVAAEAESATLAARRAQLDSLGLDDPGQGSVESARPNVLPYRSRGASPGSTDLSRRMVAHGGISFWDASAREVAEAMSHVGVQSCGQCGLSLSASAHFCRRCGTQQARSA